MASPSKLESRTPLTAGAGTARTITDRQMDATKAALNVVIRGGYPATCSELVGFGASFERERRRGALRDRLADLIEPARPDLGLVLRRRVAVRLHRELLLLQLHIGGHALGRVALGQVEHAGVERVEPRQRDELEPVAHRAELLLELRDLRVVERLLPVERRRAVVGEELAGE